MRRIPLFLAALTALVGSVAFAQSDEGERAQLMLAKQQAEEALRRSEMLEQQAEQATSQAARARAAAEALAARIQASEADITAAETRLRIVESLARAQRARLGQQQEPVVRLTAALQNMARRPPALALVQPGSIDDIVHVRSLLASTLPEIRRRTAGLREEVAQGARLRAQAQQARQALVASREQLQQRRTELAQLEADQRARSENLLELAVTESDRALALGEEARQLATLVETQRFQRRLEARLTELPGPLPRPNSQGAQERRGRYMLPVGGELVTGVGEISDGGVHSRGLTFRTDPRAEVVAPLAGRVVYAGPFRSYGQIVIIDHGAGWSSVVTRLATLEVRQGQTVSRGRPIGRAGPDEPLVSVELRRNGTPVSITQLLA